jgi:preprotein translocase subunit YajC
MGFDLKQLLPYIALWVLLLAAFFWFIIRPKKVAATQHKEFLDGLQRGDRVVTAGGIYGEIVGLDDETVRLKVASDVELTFDRRAVRRRQGGTGT